MRNRSLAAAKRARTRTGIGRNAVSVSYVAVELARKIFGDLTGRGVLMLGSGKMGALAARLLVRGGARAAVLGGRSLDRAERLAAAIGARSAPRESLREELARTDIVISGTAAPVLVIRREDVEATRAARRGRPLFLIDIALPRDIDPSVREIDGVFLYDLDDLKSVAEANRRERERQAAAAEAIVEREVREFLGWERSRHVLPLLVELRRRAEEVRRAEVDRALRRLGPLTPEQEEALEALSAAIVNKLLHPMTVHLKQAAQDGWASEQATLIQKLLGLEARPRGEEALEEGPAAPTPQSARQLCKMSI